MFAGLDDTLTIEPIHLSGLYVTGCLEEAPGLRNFIFLVL